ncbi:MAG: hypothetical protein OXC92_09965 [Flavobacteriaceae bacterium]|nr:hypothetical protein [Flavobacteriaceae bacterium]
MSRRVYFPFDSMPQWIGLGSDEMMGAFSLSAFRPNSTHIGIELKRGG